nr:integrase, catalytic region, zinc finger, CCHC-type, peptidase aspartic, catalytic [Tanacetum cinerariifolium]
GKLFQNLLLNQKCIGYLIRADYSISPTRYNKDDSCWGADLKSKTTKDIINIGSFMEVLVLNQYVLVRKIFYTVRFLRVSLVPSTETCRELDIRTVDYAVEGLLRKVSAEKAWATIEELARYEDEGWDDPVVLEKESPNYKNPDLEQLLGIMKCKFKTLMDEGIKLIGRSDSIFRILLINEMIDALSVEPRAYVFKKKYLIAMKVLLDLGEEVEVDDQAIQTILLGLLEDIYAAVDSCETTQEIWLCVQQMMKGSDIGIQEKKAKLFNEWERNQIVSNVVQNPSVQNVRNQNGLIVVPRNANPNTNQIGNQASTSGTQTDKAPVYDSDGSTKDDCYVQATNIILLGLPPDVYELVNHQEIAKAIWDKVKLLMKGTKLSYQERECRLYNLFDKYASIQAWFKEKAMLAEAQEADEILDKEQLAFLADPGMDEAPVAQ